MTDWEIKQGDVLAVLRGMESESVQCVVTSPPYFGLRDYGANGQLGLEKTPAEYVAALVEVFREVRRVLRKDGTCWVNLGDSYAGNNNGYSGDSRPSNAAGSLTAKNNGTRTMNQKRTVGDGLKPKDLMMIPARVALALQDDGWYLRSEITWCKRAPMPESVKDRPTSATEKIYLLTKSANYYYDQEAVREPVKPESLERYNYSLNSATSGFVRDSREGSSWGKMREGAKMGEFMNPNGRNQWNYLVLPTDRYRLRADLTPEQRAYVLQRIFASDYPVADDSQMSNNGHPDV